LAASPSDDAGAAVPLRWILVELIAGIQLGHQPVVFYRTAPSALCFGRIGHVFLPCLHLALFL
jgi:hypothetical protein